MSAKSDPLPPIELIITLKKPIEGPAGPVSQITLREPTGAEAMMWDKLDGYEADILALSVVAAVPKSVIEKMGVSQIIEGSRYIQRFLA